MRDDALRVCDLAHELGMSSAELVRVARLLGVRVIRATALLSAGQVYKIRAHVERNRRLVTSSAARTSSRDEPQTHDTAPRRRFARCACCDFQFPVPLTGAPLICDDCLLHVFAAGEPLERELARVRDHEGKARLLGEKYREAARGLAEERDLAFRKRDKWMAALVEVVMAHAPDEGSAGCVCGAPDYPCVTRRHLRYSNRGIYERCEALEALPEDDLERVLYGRELSLFRDLDAEQE